MQTLLLTAADVTRYLTTERCISAVEAGFRALGAGMAEPPVTVGVHLPDGGFHIKAGVLDLGRKYFAAKSNGNFPGNPRVHNLPTIQGLVILCDAETGTVLAVIDSVEITAKRTAAATAVAARHLARADSRVAAICGCGFQAAYQVEALRTVLPIDQWIAVDADANRARDFARLLSARDGLECKAASLSDAVRAEPDVWVTCTTSTEFFLFPEHVKEGAFVAGVGVDNEMKRELAPTLLQRSHVVADVVGQCERIGDLHHLVAAGLQAKSVHELGKIVAANDDGRSDERSIYVFDSTGIAIQDVAACAAVYEAAVVAREAGEQLNAINFSA